MAEVRRSKSLIELNLASNEITNEGMTSIFDSLSDNQSITSVNLSTVDGVSRNRLTEGAFPALKHFLKVNEFIEILDLSSVGLGNAGLETLCDVINP